jgi:hypothetical protein
MKKYYELRFQDGMVIVVNTVSCAKRGKPKKVATFKTLRAAEQFIAYA